MEFGIKSLVFVLGTFTLNAASAQGSYDGKLAAHLSRIYQSDQKYRSAAIGVAKKFGSGSKQDDELMRRQDSIDLKNLEEIEQIISIYGYPGKSKVGSQAKVAFMVVQHNSPQAQEKYLPQFVSAVEKGELDRSLLPLMIDRIRTAKGQAQLYGTQLLEIKGVGIQVFPIEDEINVDVRRKAAGLNSLQSYYKGWDIDYVLPTAAGNQNPKNLYVDMNARRETTVEAVGGDRAILTKLRYPEKAKLAGVTGSVMLQFCVDALGNTGDISIVKGLGYGCDEEAIRVVREAKYTNKSGEVHELRMSFPFPFKVVGEQEKNPKN